MPYYLVVLWVLMIIACIWPLYRLRRMRKTSTCQTNNVDWSCDFLRQLDTWERERCIKTVERIRIGIKFDERASSMLANLCEWTSKGRLDVLGMALVIYYCMEEERRKLHAHKAGVFVLHEGANGPIEERFIVS